MPASSDLLIIGAGVAGLTAAARASELGLRVTVLEAGTDEDYICNSRLTGGVFHVGMDNILLEPPQVRAVIERVTRGHARPDLADALANNARRAVDWLRTQGIRFIKGPTSDMAAVLSPPKLVQFGLHWKGRAGDVFLRTLAERIAERSGQILRGVRARELVMRDGACIGVKAERAGRMEEFSAGAVLLADGGFQGNNELVGRAISPAPDKVFQRNASTGIGDGLRMAEAIGAKLVDLDRFYGHILHRDVFGNDTLWPYPMIDVLALAGIAVDGEGKRFADEGLGGVYIANRIAGLKDPLSVTVVFDEAIWQGPGTSWVLNPNPYIEVAGAKVTQAPTIEALATASGLDPQKLAATVAEYNAAVENGTLTALQPPRGNAPFQAHPIKVPPFRAVPVCAGITYTMGGIAIDADARVLRTDGTVIPGLLAAGATTGGIEGGHHAGYTGGLSKASTFGLLAAEYAARTLKPQAARASA